MLAIVASKVGDCGWSGLACVLLFVKVGNVVAFWVCQLFVLYSWLICIIVTVNNYCSGLLSTIFIFFIDYRIANNSIVQLYFRGFSTNVDIDHDRKATTKIIPQIVLPKANYDIILKRQTTKITNHYAALIISQSKLSLLSAYIFVGIAQFQN